LHGDINANGYLFNGIVYISDCSSISTVNLKKILNPNLLILDCLKYKKHATHLNFNKSLYYINKIKPKKTILTNLHSDIDYSSFKKKLEKISKKIVPAFDGLRVKI
jgi:phosphoribosyl 1,2-cyclic phosphate phosphodiesterase